MVPFGMQGYVETKSITLARWAAISSSPGLACATLSTSSGRLNELRHGPHHISAAMLNLHRYPRAALLMDKLGQINIGEVASLGSDREDGLTVVGLPQTFNGDNREN